MPYLALALSLSLACACDGAGCPDGSVSTSDRCARPDATPPRDAGPNDAGRRDTDAGPCGVCAAPTPMCDESTGDCVGCLVMNDCAGTTPQCDPVMHECVACLSSADCTDPDNARCAADHTCQPCTDSMQCMGITGTEVCDSGTCVECTATSDCSGTDTCNLLDNTCVDVLLGSLRTCSACSNDDQCPASHRCVPMTFMGPMRDPGYYCLLQADESGGCENPFTAGTLIDRQSINGAPMERYCAIDEMVTSCEAVRGLLDDWRCDAGVDGRCYPIGHPELAIDIPGARCEDLASGTVTNRCTYDCGGASDCKLAGAGSTCGNGGMADPDYCGG
ncbi:MAG: hypothetical protein AB7S26_38505 [Sandaracinaceae bacterium]